MPLFSRSEQSYLGIDFHSNNVKVVELKNEAGRPKLVTYGYVDLNLERPKITDNKQSHAVIAKVIKQVCQQAKTTTTNVITALPAYLVFSSIFNLSPLPKKQLVEAINREAQKVIPMPIEKMVLDWKILKNGTAPSIQSDQSSNGQENKNSDSIKSRQALKISPDKKVKTVRALLTAAPKEDVKNYINIFKTAKLNLLILDTEPFALIRSLVGNDKSALLIVDIGSIVTNLTVVVEGIPVLHRSIRVGGLNITQALAENLNVDLARAEQFKYDVGVADSQDLNNQVPKAIEATLTPVVDEIKYTLNMYKQQGGRRLEKVILTGGSSLLLNLPEYLANIINLKVYRGDPWARVVCPDELKPVLDEIGARFSVAIGLAMRYIE